MKDGLYELFYRAASSPEGSFESMMLVLRSGRILAADQWGGVYLGRCDYNAKTRNHHIDVQFHIPEGGVLVTDDAPRQSASHIHIDTDIGDGEGPTRIQIDGREVIMTLKFKGPAPST